MDQPVVQHHTFTIERTYSKPPARVFAAFADPAQKRRWFASPNAEVFELDFRVGGQERTVSRLGPNTPFPGVAMIGEAGFLDIVPDRRIVAWSTMTLGERRISASLMTFEFLGVGPNGHQSTADGARLLITHQGAFFEGSDGPAMREAGWRSIFDRLTSELS